MRLRCMDSSTVVPQWWELFIQKSSPDQFYKQFRKQFTISLGKAFVLLEQCQNLPTDLKKKNIITHLFSWLAVNLEYIFFLMGFHCLIVLYVAFQCEPSLRSWLRHKLTHLNFKETKTWERWYSRNGLLGQVILIRSGRSGQLVSQGWITVNIRHNVTC